MTTALSHPQHQHLVDPGSPSRGPGDGPRTPSSARPRRRTPTPARPGPRAERRAGRPTTSGARASREPGPAEPPPPRAPCAVPAPPSCAPGRRAGRGRSPSIPDTSAPPRPARRPAPRPSRMTRQLLEKPAELHEPHDRRPRPNVMPSKAAATRGYGGLVLKWARCTSGRGRGRRAWSGVREVRPPPSRRGRESWLPSRHPTT